VAAVVAVALLSWAAMLVRSWWSRGAGGRTRTRPDPRLVQTAVVLTLIAQTGLTLAVEILYVATGGAPITRYLLPALLPIGALLAAGVLGVGRRAAPVALLVYLAVAWSLFVQWLWLSGGPAGLPTSGSTPNDVPWTVVWVALVGLAVSVVLQPVGLIRRRAGA
jgi:hypothetical protein